MSREKALETITTYPERNLHDSQVDITDLPSELMLEIFSGLSVRDLCQCVAPVCKEWSILARHPSLWKELSFGKGISKSNVLKILRESPLLRKLSLKGRRDTDAILRRVCRSNRHIETLKILGCRGSVRRREVNGIILTGILKGCPKLCHLLLKGTLVKSVEFYRTLARLGDHTKSFKILGATKAGMLCFLRTRAKLHHRHSALLNGERRDVRDIIQLMSRNSAAVKWSLDVSD
jgi:hypothetical protein